ncbi:mechanosensitive ion channel family protein [Streptomyces sp. APSN-46.1]|uniref:mechanosensitive ion channel family protein n=1 Tax=Streptomyces sp. APSN-46.1 TaxID=2929049 RepID=UPI001FB5351E|nr:mechanosensitive ion channel domain-containing protein [Streptomyces sp. APSN-46.1]MCJ1681225.1 mechanosensitive ion channel family protein [Streptomyces sp. APSN-46.1]
METVLRPLAVIGGSVVITLLAGWLLDLLLRRADARHSETPLWGLLRRCRLPFQLTLCTSLVRGSYRQARVLPDHAVGVGRALTLILIAGAAWLLVRIATAAVDSMYARYAAGSPDDARVRRVRTQVTLIQRVVTAAVVVVAGASMLLTFPPMRAFGASMLASAGVLGIVAGIAAQSSLSNLFAGLQIAFGDTVRIGDTVVVDGEWGKVEEITLTFLVVRTWDERRITMPVSYFTSKPYENWSRGGAQMTGTVFLHLDHSAPVPLMREWLADILKETPEWDGRGSGLVVTDTTPHTIQVRATVTAKDADDLWTLRCAVRERLIAWLVEHHPYALPRVTTEAAPDTPRPPAP